MDVLDVVLGPAQLWVRDVPAEIWNLIGDQIQGVTTFKSLVQVCREFRDIFVPFLHRRRVLDLHKVRFSDLMEMPLPAEMKYTKEFEVHLDEFRLPVTYFPDFNEDYACATARMLEAMPNLQAFRWFDNAFIDECHTALILRSQTLIDALQAHKTLTQLSIQFTNSFEIDLPGVSNCFIPLSGFGNLTSLELYSFYGDEDYLINEIADVLGRCPRLEKLGLGMASDLDCEGHPEVLVMPARCDFLERLCLKYGSKQRAEPLALATLALGHGMFLYSSKSNSVDNFLAKLVKIEELRNFHLFNGSVRNDLEGGDNEWMNCTWNLLNGCTSLRQLSVTRLEEDLREWLNFSGSTVEELIITDHYRERDEGFENFDALMLPRLSMLSIREMAGQRLDDLWALNSDWESIDSDDDSAESESEQNISPPVTFEPPQGAGKSQINVLDRLYDRGCCLARLAMCVDFGPDFDRLCLQLEKMRLLTQLKLCPKSHQSGRYPPRESSLWPGVQKEEDIAYHYAQLLKSKIPSLQYIQIADWAWQVMSPIGTLRDKDTDIHACVKLRKLEFHEKLAIELFATERFSNQAGLCGPEQFHEELSEEEKDLIQEICDEFAVRLQDGTYEEWVQQLAQRSADA